MLSIAICDDEIRIQQTLASKVNEHLKRVLKDERAQYLLVKKGGDIAKICLSDILYCEIINHRLAIHTSIGISGAGKVKEKIAFLRSGGLDGYPIDLVCRTLGIGRSTYYKRKGEPETHRENAENELLLVAEKLIKENNEEYGRKRLNKALRKAGHTMSEGKTRKLMRRGGLWPKRAKKYKATTNSRHKYQVAETILNREFTAANPNQKWCGDREHRTRKEAFRGAGHESYHLLEVLFYEKAPRAFLN